MRFVKIENGLPETDGLYHCRVTYDGENIEKVFLMWSLGNWHSDVDVMEGTKIISWLDEQDEGWVPVGEGSPVLSKAYTVYNPFAVVKIYTAFCMPISDSDTPHVFGNGSPDYHVTHYRELPAPPATT